MLQIRAGRSADRLDHAPAVSYEQEDTPTFTLADVATARRIRAFDRVLTLFSECSRAGWDGEDADPICVTTLAGARDFLLILPAAFPSPEVSAEVDDGITFDWLRPDGRTFSLTIYGDRTAVWAAVVEGQLESGEFEFLDNIPAEVTEQLKRICQD